MKKGIIIVVAIMLFSLSVIGALIYKSNTTVSSDYFAKLQTGGPALLCTYLYINNGQYAYINTKEISHEAPPYKITIKVIKRGNLEYPQNIFEVAEKHGSLGAAILNKDISETNWHKGYKKGDIVTDEELWELVAIIN